MMKAIIVDDEDLARRVLREYLEQEPGVEIVAECTNGFEAVKAIAEHEPDVVFLDVQMPKLDGFEVLELIDRRSGVIFVTAFDQYAMRAFDAAAVDYLLKPFGIDRLRAALKKLKGGSAGTAPAAVELRNAARPAGEYLERIVVKETVKDGARVHVMPAGKLDYAEAQDDYVALRSEGHTWLKQQTIASLENALDPKRFIRIHRGFLVNIERIARIEPNTKDTWVAVLTDGARIPVSRAGYTRFNSLLTG
jgi:two-component system, LytTR family, response regulator